MRSASVQRIENMERLIAALAQRSMGPRAVMELLNISDRAARNYLKDLEDAGVGEPDPGSRTRLRLHADSAVPKRFLAMLRQCAHQQQVALRRSLSHHGSHSGGRFLHVLADDVRFPLILHRHPVRRDPLVTALFGSGHCVSNHK